MMIHLTLKTSLMFRPLEGMNLSGIHPFFVTIGGIIVIRSGQWGWRSQVRSLYPV